MKTLKKNLLGIAICAIIAIPSYIMGSHFTFIGGPVFAILIGMTIAVIYKGKYGKAECGIKFTSKYILQTAVVLLGFGLDLNVVLKTGRQSLPIVICTISTSLILAYILCKSMKIRKNTAILIGVGSSICGGSAIAATAPVIGADDDEIAQAISVIFLFNVLAAILFPILGNLMGMARDTGEAFGVFAGTAVNDTSSVTAAASTWDSMWSLGTQTLDKAITVKLTRTLAIIPIVLVLSMKNASGNDKTGKFRLRSAFPMFILWFIVASVITTFATGFSINTDIFKHLKILSKFFIIMSMGAIGINTDIVKLIKTSQKPMLLGFICWGGITIVCMVMQRLMNIW